MLNQPISNAKRLPKKLHFIWVGDDPIPEKYMRTMLAVAAIAKRDGFDFNLWVDNPKIFNKSLNKLDKYQVLDNINPEKLGIRLRDVNELKPRMIGKNADDFYKGTDPNFKLAKNEGDRGKNFWRYVERERVGSKNLAAAADFFRYEIMRQEGGYYFDVDTEFPDVTSLAAKKEYFKKSQKGLNEADETSIINFLTQLKSQNSSDDTWMSDTQLLETVSPSNTGATLKVDAPPHGMVFNFDPIHHLYKNQVKVNLDFTGGLNNDGFGMQPNHEVMRGALYESLNKYKKLDTQHMEWDKEGKNVSSQYKHPDMLSYQEAKQSNMDRKRLPIKKGHRFFPRREFTIASSGPGALKKSLKQFFERQKITTMSKTDYKNIFKGNGDSNNPSAVLAGLNIVGKCDGTWLKKKEKIPSYTAESLPNHFYFRSAKGKVKQDINLKKRKIDERDYQENTASTESSTTISNTTTSNKKHKK